MCQWNWVTVVFFNHEKHEQTRKKCMTVALIVCLRGSCHEFFSCLFVLFVVQKISMPPCFSDALLFILDIKKKESVQWQD